MKSKVLLIDDSVTIHRVIDLSIDVDRYDIVKVFSKEDADIKMQSEQFDYILLDNKLDNIVISDYIKELKTALPSASIILLVGAFDRFDESNLEKTGADDYLVKPFDSQSLNEKLSSDADMMPAGIVEKIAEADFARDNDDYIAPTSSLTTGEVIDGLSKKEYLENLEEVQPDDLTDNGYVEDLDAAPSLEFDKLPQEAEEAWQKNQEEKTEEEQSEIGNDAEESSIIEESPEEDIIIAENNEDEKENIAFNGNDKVSETVLNEDTETFEPLFAPREETAEVAENEEGIDIPSIEENIEDKELSVPETAVDEPAAVLDTSLSEDTYEEENIPANTEEIEIPDNITAVHNPVLPDIDDAADISDEYVMQDNIEKADNISQNDMLDEFPDFPEVDDMQADELQDMQETADNQIQETDNTDNIFNTEEHEEVQENLLVDDDDWLSDAPAAYEETTANTQAEEPQLDLSEETSNIAENKENEEENIFVEDNDNNIQEETSPIEEHMEEVMPEIQEQVEEEMPVLFDDKAEEEKEGSFNTVSEEPVQAEEKQENAQEDMEAEETFILAEDNYKEEESSPIEEVSFDMTEEVKAENTETVNEEPYIEETVLPIEQEENNKQMVANINQVEVKQAEEYSPEKSGRFGGITVTISRDEIIAMLGNAIDKHFLEEAVKEVIASNMKEIVRNIVPAIAEKYIKEEIERLKNDE